MTHDTLLRLMTPSFASPVHPESDLVRPREIRELALNTLAQMGAAAEPYGRKLGQMLADDEAIRSDHNRCFAHMCLFCCCLC